MSVTRRRWNSETKEYDTTVEYVGFTVDCGSHYLGDGDSDYYAVCFDPDEGKFVEAHLGYTPDGYSIDATDDVRQAWEAEVASRKAQTLAVRLAYMVQDRVRDERIEAITPSKGKKVRVVKGRKVPVGTEGTVKVYHEGQWGWSVLIDTGEDEVWTAASNVEVIPAEEPVAA